MVRRISFLSGLLLGSALCGWFLGGALVYVFTGQAISLWTGPEGVRVRLNDLALREVLPGKEEG